MTPILNAISSFGLPTVAAAVLIFVLVKGEFVFRYPSRRARPEDRERGIR